MDDQTHRQTDHIRRKHEFDGIEDPDEVRTLIEGAAIDETNAQILLLHYIKRKNFGYIADTLGFAYPTVIARHNKALARVLAYRKIRKG